MENNQIIYGIHPIIEALRSGKTIDKLMIQNSISNDTLRELKEEMKTSKQFIQVQYVPIEKLNKLTNNNNHQGVVAVSASVVYKDLEEIITKCKENKKMPFFVMLDHITDVRNFGAIARTCECASVDCIIVPCEGCAPINQDAIKTSAGALLRIPICKITNTKTTLNLLKQMDIQIFSATEKANKVYTCCDFNKPLLLIMGAEDKGISKDCLRMSDELIKIPLQGEIESLNVSVATGVILYEILRQRNIK